MFSLSLFPLQDGADRVRKDSHCRLELGSINLQKNSNDSFSSNPVNPSRPLLSHTLLHPRPLPLPPLQVDRKVEVWCLNWKDRRIQLRLRDRKKSWESGWVRLRIVIELRQRGWGDSNKSISIFNYRNYWEWVTFFRRLIWKNGSWLWFSFPLFPLSLVLAELEGRFRWIGFRYSIPPIPLRVLIRIPSRNRRTHSLSRFNRRWSVFPRPLLPTPHPSHWNHERELGPGVKSVIESIDAQEDFKTYMQQYALNWQMSGQRGPRRDVPNDTTSTYVRLSRISSLNFPLSKTHTFISSSKARTPSNFTSRLFLDSRNETISPFPYRSNLEPNFRSRFRRSNVTRFSWSSSSSYEMRRSDWKGRIGFNGYLSFEWNYFESTAVKGLFG